MRYRMKMEAACHSVNLATIYDLRICLQGTTKLLYDTSVHLTMYTQKLCNISTFIILRRLTRVGRLQRSRDARNTKKKHQVNLHKKRPKARWKHDEQSDVRKTSIVNWRQIAHDGGEQLETGLTLLGIVGPQ